jgi:hypothetical protein
MIPSRDGVDVPDVQMEDDELEECRGMGTTYP